MVNGNRQQTFQGGPEAGLTHTQNHVDCPACLRLGSMGHVEIDPETLFPAAYDRWLEIKAPEIRDRTLRGYRLAGKSLSAFFGGLRLMEITIGHIRAYQIERGKKAGPNLLNGECSCLGMMLSEAGLWEELKPRYKPRHVPKRGSGHSLSATEEERLRQVAKQHPKWALASHCMAAMLSTTMNWGELSTLRRRDVNLDKRVVSVREGKNEHRERDIPMNNAALEEFRWIIHRWEDLGGRNSEDFLLPKRPRSINGPWIFTEHTVSIKTAFRKIRKEAGLDHFRIHDCRVQAITKLLSNPKVSRQVAKEIAGHISQEMQDRYSIQHFDTKMEALEALEGPTKPQAPKLVEKPAVIERKPVKSESEADVAQEFADFLRWRQVRA